jgi:hypothetical protein
VDECNFEFENQSWNEYEGMRSTGSIILMDKGTDSEMEVRSDAITAELVVGNKLTFSNRWLATN